jgi:DNA polymerase IV
LIDSNTSQPAEGRIIIHIDMDCFYAAIEMREHPELAGKPIAVGGSTRGVLTTCNYLAREFGCRSAMPAFKAMKLCPNLILLPVRFDLYRAESMKIREIFAQFTDLVEPLSLDEAYLDVSQLRSGGRYIAAEIRARIRETTQLTASAGIAPNKFLAKVASDWNKPNGQYEVTADGIADFVAALPVEKIWGVGKRTADKIHRLGAKTCGDLQKWSELDLHRYFGRFGSDLYHLSRGMDNRAVEPHRERKSVSNEQTFRQNITELEEAIEPFASQIEELEKDLIKHPNRLIREGFVKLKFQDFTLTTAQQPMSQLDAVVFHQLLQEAWARSEGKSIRLIGVGVRFVPEEEAVARQLEMFPL